MEPSTDIALSPELEALESQLSELSPSALPEQMLQRMEQAMMNWQEQEQAVSTAVKIIPFATETAPPRHEGNSKYHIWGAAAAIALMAAVVTVLNIGKGDSDNTLATQQTSQSSAAQSPASSLLPIRENAAIVNDSTTLSKHFSNNITNASNEGITYAGDEQIPYQILRIEYTKEIIRTDANGYQTTVRVPATETILLPVRVH